MAKTDFTDAALGMTQAELGGEIISQTLDALNSPMCGSSSKCDGSGGRADMSDTYNLSKSVLGAYYFGKGTAVDSKG